LVSAAAIASSLASESNPFLSLSLTNLAVRVFLVFVLFGTTLLTVSDIRLRPLQRMMFGAFFAFFSADLVHDVVFVITGSSEYSADYAAFFTAAVIPTIIGGLLLRKPHQDEALK
jgi:hypothetical protein